MIYLELECYVTKADDNCIRVMSKGNKKNENLIKLGFIFDIKNSDYYFEVNDFNEKGRIFSLLRDMGIGFLGGREWSPSEVFEYLRDMRVVSGKYKRVFWKGPDDMHVEYN